jgi:uncharacterized membrane protein
VPALEKQAQIPEEVEVRLADSFRVEAFSDAVFAIAMTLLVVDLKIPEAGAGTLLDDLLRQWPAYVAYLASFSYIAVIWANHHALFTRIRYVDGGVKWANVGVLLCSATLPFPTAVVSRALEAHGLADERTAIALYALIAALLCLSWVVLWAYLRAHPHLLEDHVDPDFFRDEQLRGVLGIALYTAAGFAGVLVKADIGLAIFALLPLFYALTSDGLRDAPIVGKHVGRRG